jgi:hypothetical protein
VYLHRIVDGAETARIAVSKEGMDRISASTAAETFRDGVCGIQCAGEFEAVKLCSKFAIKRTCVVLFSYITQS